ncbi:Mov34/MPN/PAD-1 family protein [Streptomyces sp. enrichment culture]|uniref:Mov34/MPN/PAD-1 family protein n=1 Tax=Streptomyces sp. enrichment culture TaxID=1795815 RepID=UPI003F54D40E
MPRPLRRNKTGDDITLDRDWGVTLLDYFARFPTERGGVLVGKRSAGHVGITAAIFPPQQESTPTRCSFDTSVIEGVNDTLKAVRPTRLGEYAVAVLGWVHSHPRMGVFLSAQDQHTLTTWTDLDESAVALVADPFARDTRIAGWGRTCAPRRLLVRDEREGLLLNQGAKLADVLSGVAQPGQRGLWDVVGSGGVVSVRVSGRTAAHRAREAR